MKLKKLVGSKEGWVAAGFALGLLCYGLLFDMDRDRRFALYNIMRDLKKDMPRQQVQTIIQRHDAPYLNKDIDRNYISIWVNLGMADTRFLSISFSHNRLSGARIRGEDGDHETFRDAPPDIP